MPTPKSTSKKRQKRKVWSEYLKPVLKLILEENVLSPSNTKKQLGGGVGTHVKVFDNLVEYGGLRKVGAFYEIEDRTVLELALEGGLPPAKGRRKRRSQAEIELAEEVAEVEAAIAFLGDKKSSRGKVWQRILGKVRRPSVSQNQLDDLRKRFEELLKAS